MDSLTIAALNFNGAFYLDRFLSSIPYAIAGVRLKNVLIDNHSTDDSWKIAERKDWDIIHADNKNKFITGLNTAIENCTTDYLLFTQSDLVFQEDCVRHLMKSIEEHPLSIIQPVILNPNLSIDNAGMNWIWPGYGIRRIRKKSNSLYSTQIVTSITFITSKKVLDKIGLFDPIFSPAYYEDCDYSLRAKKEKVALYVQPNASVIHWHTSAFSSIYSKNQLSEICFLNRQKVIEKHYKGWDRKLRLRLIRANQELRNATGEWGNKMASGF